MSLSRWNEEKVYEEAAPLSDDKETLVVRENENQGERW